MVSKPAPETVNLRGSKAVPEIQEFSLTLKPARVGNTPPIDVLRCIDRAIDFPVIFELVAGREDGASRDQIRVAATCKRPAKPMPMKPYSVTIFTAIGYRAMREARQTLWAAQAGISREAVRDSQ